MNDLFLLSPDLSNLTKTFGINLNVSNYPLPDLLHQTKSGDTWKVLYHLKLLKSILSAILGAAAITLLLESRVGVIWACALAADDLNICGFFKQVRPYFEYVHTSLRAKENVKKEQMRLRPRPLRFGQLNIPIRERKQEKEM